MSRKWQDGIGICKELSFSKPFTEYFGYYQNNIDELVLLRFKTERLCKFNRQLLPQGQSSIVEWNILQSFEQNHCAKFVQMISALEVT